jgi:hypothetical protein
MATARIGDFNRDVDRAKELIGLGQTVAKLTNGLIDGTDLYRAALVQGVAALDRYIHGVVLDRSVDILFGRLPATNAAKVALPLSAVAAVVNEPDPAQREVAARSLLAESLGRQTFQRPDDIAAALATVGIQALWKSLFLDPAQVKISLGVVVDRRNKIVHQCDYDPAGAGALTPLSDRDARDSVDTVDGIVQQIDKAL